jgi:hypothetical protein
MDQILNECQEKINKRMSYSFQKRKRNADTDIYKEERKKKRTDN